MAISGAVAGAAVATRLLGLEPRGIADGVGIAVSLASGSLEANRSDGWHDQAPAVMPGPQAPPCVPLVSLRADAAH